MSKHHEKLPLSSKKFLAYMVADLGWKIVLGFLIYQNCTGDSLVLMLSIVIVSGFVQVGYILGQAALDRYVRVAEISTRLGKETISNVLENKETVEEPQSKAEIDPEDR